MKRILILFATIFLILISSFAFAGNDNEFSGMAGPVNIEKQVAEPKPAADTPDTVKKSRFEKYFVPAKLDNLFTYQQNYLNGNFFIWSEAVKAGFGAVFNGKDIIAHYGGTFFRPLVGTKYKGDLIIGANYYMPYPHQTLYDIQIENRHDFGLCYGGGVVRGSLASTPAEIDGWGKIGWRFKLKKNWALTLTAQALEYEKQVRPGGWAAAYNPMFMVAGGYDYEMWKACIGIMAPDKGSRYRPVFEAVYTDNNIGTDKSVRFLFVNFTLAIKGGFLSNAARLGRAMGPTGLEFANPLGFIFSPKYPVTNWNRKLNSWEMGRMLDFRVENYVLPDNKSYNGYAQLVVLPFQFVTMHKLLDPFFFGGEVVYTKVVAATGKVTTMSQQGGILAGYYYNQTNYSASLGIEYVVANHQPIATIGVIIKKL